MNNLYLDYEEAKIVGSKLQEESDVLKQLLDKLYDINEKLEGSIKSEIMDEYSKPLLSNTKTMYKLAELTKVTGSALSNISSAYYSVEKNGINSEEN